MASHEAVYSDLSHSLLSMCSALLNDIEEGRQQTLFEGSSHVAQHEASQPQNRNYQTPLGGIEASHSGRDKILGLDNTGYGELGQESPAHDEVSHLGNLLSNGPDGIRSSCFSDTSSKPTILDHSSAPSASGVKTVSTPSCDEEKSQTDVKFLCRECGKEFNHQRFYREHCRIHTGERPLECKYCGKSFRRSNALYVHERVHTREKRYSCRICEKTFGRSDTLKTHIRTHTGEKPYKCSFCDRRFNQRNGRILHEKVHENDKMFTCDECGMKFRQKFGLQNHQRASVVTRKCTECGKVCPNLCTLRVHRQQLHNKKLYSCDECGTSFATERKLGKHCPCSSSNQTVFVCKQCARAFDNLQDLGSHECSKIYRRSVTCDVCEQKFSSIEDWKTHRLGHSKKKVFQCIHCDMVFKAKRNLLRHTPLHAMLRNGSLCSSNPIDGETSSTEVAEVSATPTIADLVNGNNNMHGQTEPYSNNGTLTNEEQQQTSWTTLYDINISNDQSLQTSSKAPVIPLYPHPGSLSNKSPATDLHLQNRSSAIVNTNIRENVGEKTPCSTQAFVCSDCGKSFGKRRSYTAHQRTHRLERPHKCKFCGMGFKQALTLTHHVRKHTGEKPFICEVCNKCFIRSDGLRSHMLIHTGYKPYKCMFCEEWFDQRSSRAVHEKAHSENGVTMCESGKDLEENCSSYTQSTHPDVCLQSLDKETGEKAPTQARILVCLECGKVFRKRRSYTAHLRTHSPKRPHKCKFCEKSFRQSTALRHHVRKHTGEKPFACLICKKNFSRSDSLRTHMFIHTGTKPYKCKFCDTWFNQRGSRYSHEMMHGSNKKLICC